MYYNIFMIFMSVKMLQNLKIGNVTPYMAISDCTDCIIAAGSHRTSGGIFACPYLW